MKYADRRNAPAVVIEGSQEREQGNVQIKDLIAGAEAAEGHHRQRRMEGRARPAQFNVDRAELVAGVQTRAGRARLADGRA